PTEGLLHNNHNQPRTIAGLCPLLHSLCAHHWNAVQDVMVLLEDCAEFLGQCEGNSNVRNVGKDGLQVCLPFFCCSLAATRTEPRLASVKNELGLSLRCVYFCTEGDRPALDDFLEGCADMLWSTFVIPVLLAVKQ